MRSANILSAAVVAVALGLGGAAFAQDTSISDNGGIPPVSAGGGRPSSPGAADRTGSITATGQTKPPGAPVGAPGGPRGEIVEKTMEVDRLVKDGICKGC